MMLSTKKFSMFMSRAMAVTQLSRLVIDHDENFFILYFFNFVFPVILFYMFTIFIEKNQP